MGNSDAAEAIQRLLGAWPRLRSESIDEIRGRLRGRITESLPLRSLRAIPNGNWKLAGSPLIVSGIAKCLVTDTKRPDAQMPALLELHRQPDDSWLLTSFEQQCPVCFGTGVNDPRLCDFCFGVGWGVFDDDYVQDSGATEAIEQLLAVWPKSRDEPEESIRSRLRGRSADALSLPSLRTVAAGGWRIACPPLVSSGVAKCLLVDTNHPKTRALIELHAQPGGWLLTAFDAECPVCFGAGINNDCVCDLCFGVGWGTR
jgi:hypothetical protein